MIKPRAAGLVRWPAAAAAADRRGVARLILWVPIEKLFMTQIGFDAASVGVMAAAYAAVVPLLEVRRFWRIAGAAAG